MAKICLDCGNYLTQQVKMVPSTNEVITIDSKGVETKIDEPCSIEVLDDGQYCETCDKMWMDSELHYTLHLIKENIALKKRLAVVEKELGL